MRIMIRIILIIMLLFSYSNAWSKVPNKERILSEFLYYVADYIEWNKESIVFCSYGTDYISNGLADIIRNKKLVRVSSVSYLPEIKLRDIELCDILYIAKSREKDVLKITNETENKNILTISNINNFSDKGGIIGFRYFRGRVQITVNDNSLEKSGLTLNPIIMFSNKNRHLSG